MKRPLKIFAWTAGALLLLLVAAIIIIPLVFDPNDYRDEIGSLVKKQTGRELVIEGDLGLSVFPWLGVEVGATQLGNAPGFGPEPFARFEEANIKVKLLPLLRREVQLDKVELVGLRLHLARDRNGRSNWEDLVKAAAKEREPEQPREEAPGAPAIPALRLEGLEVRDGRVTWDDRAAGRRAEISNLEITTGALDLHSPFTFALESDFVVTPPKTSGHTKLAGTLRYDLDAQRYSTDDFVLDFTARGEKVPSGELTARLTGDLAADLEQQTAQVKSLRLTAYGTQSDLTLNASRILDKVEAEGKLTTELKDPKALRQALSDLLPAKIDAAQLAGARMGASFNLSLEQGTASLPDLSATFLGANLAANAEATGLPDNPSVRGALRLDIKDGKRLVGPFAASLPKGIQPAAFTNARFASNFDANLATERLVLKQTRLSALGLDVTTEAQGQKILSAPVFTGRLSVDEFVPRDLLGKLGIELPPMADESTLAKAALTTGFDMGKEHVALQDLQLRLDQSTLKGRIAAQRFTPLMLRYDLTLDAIDLDRYLPPPSDRPEAPPSTTAAAAAPMKLPTELLRSLDIDGTVRVGNLKASNMRSTDVLATLRGKGGAFRIHPAQAKLYQGSYSGDLGFDVRGKTPLISMDEHLSGVQMGPLLMDFMGKDYVTGRAELHAKLNARGTDAPAIRRSLGGNASFSFKDGAVNGFNIAKMIRDAYAKFRGQPVPKEEPRKTDFSELRGSVSVKEGLVSNDDLSAKSPLLRISGKGSAHLATEKINYRVTATIVSTLKGQGGRELEELKGIPIPVQIGGTFTEPRFSVPIAEALRERAGQAVEQKKQELQKQLETEREKKGKELEKSLQEELKKRGLEGLFKK